MRFGKGASESVLFGTTEHVGVDRGLGEFRAGRPVLITNESQSVIAVPVDGIDPDRLEAFRRICARAAPSVVITARRARAMGFEAACPIALAIPPKVNADGILSLVADARADCALSHSPAPPTATAGIELAKIAQLLPAVLAADADALDATAFDPPIVTVAAAAVARFRRDAIRSLAIAAEARVPLNGGLAARFVVFREAFGSNSVAVIVGEPDLSAPVPLRLHSACLTGDVFGSRRCDCGDQLRLAISRLEAAGGGIILYLAQEGRGLGLVNKIRAYKLQDAGLDTVDANTTLGFDDDERDYGIAARMLEILGCTRVVLLTNNPAKLDGLADAGIEIAGRMPLETPINADNRRYLTAKVARAGHRLEHLIASLTEAERRVPGLST